MSDATVITQLSGLGRGAVATVVVDGPMASEYVARHFTTARSGRTAQLALNQIHFGTWQGPHAVEELVVCRTEANQFEIHCHGGRVAAQHVLESLRADGASEISREAWLQRIEPDPFVRAAKRLLPAAPTERTLGILLSQAQGALRRLLEQTRDRLVQGDTTEAIAGLDRCLRFSALGAHLTRPWRIVVAGPPNAGKSSLINALVGFQRSLVFDQPGTTRDAVCVSTALDGWPLQITDTAGLRVSSHPIEAEGIRRAWQLLENAELVLVIQDLTHAAGNPPELPAATRQLLVGTKLDLAVETSDGCDVLTSAKSGEGIQALSQRIVETLVPVLPQPGDAVPLEPAATEQLRRIQQSIDAGDPPRAIDQLETLLTR